MSIKLPFHSSFQRNLISSDDVQRENGSFRTKNVEDEATKMCCYAAQRVERH